MRAIFTALFIGGLTLAGADALAEEGAVTETVATLGAVNVGQPIPTFAGFDSEGRSVRSKYLVEELGEGGMILSFFATWCAPCKAGIPVIQANAEARGWKVVLIDLGEEPEKVTPFLAGLGVPDDTTVLYDTHGTIAKRFGVGNSLPKTFVVAPSGNVGTIFVTEGADFDDKLVLAMDGPQ